MHEKGFEIRSNLRVCDLRFCYITVRKIKFSRILTKNSYCFIQEAKISKLKTHIFLNNIFPIPLTKNGSKIQTFIYLFFFYIFSVEKQKANQKRIWLGT